MDYLPDVLVSPTQILPDLMVFEYAFSHLGADANVAVGTSQVIQVAFNGQQFYDTQLPIEVVTEITLTRTVPSVVFTAPYIYAPRLYIEGINFVGSVCCVQPAFQRLCQCPLRRADIPQRDAPGR